MGPPRTVRFTQRRFQDPGGEGRPENTVDGGGRALLHALFRPIAGDALSFGPSGGGTSNGDLTSGSALRGVRFGLMSAETINALSVVAVTNKLCNESRGSLTDLRMGACLERNLACDTCKQFHHN